MMATLCSVSEYDYRRLGMWQENPGECRVRPAGQWWATLIACPYCQRALQAKVAAKLYCWPPRMYLRCAPCNYFKDSVA